MITVEKVRKMMPFNYEEVLNQHETTINIKIENVVKDG